MRIFANGMEAIREVERDLFEMGIRVQPETMQDKVIAGDADFSTLELRAYGYTLTGLGQLEEMIEYMKGSLAWANAEVKDRVRPEYINPGNAYRLKPELWEQFLRDGQFAYTYNERFREQLPLIIRELKLRPNSRQAVMTMYDRHQDMNNWGGKDRVPCSLTYQFLIREGQLDVIYTMRSCDFLTHFCHDVYMTIQVMLYVANEIGVRPGYFTHFIGSLHAYQKDMKSRGIF